MSFNQFITIPKQLSVSFDDENNYALLTSNDRETVFRVNSRFIKKEDDRYFVQIGTPVEYIKRSKLTNAMERIEIEIYEETGCTNNKKYCENGITHCCDTYEIVGSCEGEWSDC